MRALQKLCRNGNATSVTIPRPILIHLGWLPGNFVVVELLEDKSLRVRPQHDGEFAPSTVPRLFFPTAPAVTK